MPGVVNLHLLSPTAGERVFTIDQAVSVPTFCLPDQFCVSTKDCARCYFHVLLRDWLFRGGCLHSTA